MLSMIFFGLFHIAGGKKTQTAKEKQYIYISILYLNPGKHTNLQQTGFYALS